MDFDTEFFLMARRDIFIDWFVLSAYLSPAGYLKP